MIEFLVEVNKQIYDIGELVHSVSWTEKMNDGASKLEFAFVDDSVGLENGSIVRFKYKGANIFYGVVFKHSVDEKGVVKATAYDLLRYCKAKDIITIKGETAGALVKKMCNALGVKWGWVEDTKYKLPVAVKDNNTWLDVIYDAMSDTLVNTGKKYVLRDEFGNVSLRDIETLKLNTILGDESLVYGLTYEKSIDDDFYNKVILLNEDKETKKTNLQAVQDGESITKYGLLQYFEKTTKTRTAAELKAQADALLRLYNREQESLDLKCLGDVNIRAGSSFFVLISDLKLNKRLIVKSVTHDFLPAHTMDLEVYM